MTSKTKFKSDAFGAIYSAARGLHRSQTTVGTPIDPIGNARCLFRPVLGSASGGGRLVDGPMAIAAADGPRRRVAAFTGSGIEMKAANAHQLCPDRF